MRDKKKYEVNNMRSRSDKAYFFTLPSCFISALKPVNCGSLKSGICSTCRVSWTGEKKVAKGVGYGGMRKRAEYGGMKERRRGLY